MKSGKFSGNEVNNHSCGSIDNVLTVLTSDQSVIIQNRHVFSKVVMNQVANGMFERLDDLNHFRASKP